MHASEPAILGFFGLLIFATIAAQLLAVIWQHGLRYALSDRREQRENTGLAGRLERATNNSIVAMALFAPAVLLFGLYDAYSNATIILCQVFFIARVVYLGAYAFAIPLLRSLAWGVGFVATLGLYIL